VRYSLVVVGAVGDFWRSKTMTAAGRSCRNDILASLSALDLTTSSLHCHPPQRAEAEGDADY
jgi:hypothetical protein